MALFECVCVSVCALMSGMKFVLARNGFNNNCHCSEALITNKMSGTHTIPAN